MAVGSRGLRVTAFAAILGATLGRASDAAATEPPFGPFDVQTVFFVSKSDDHNRVDYGIHLDAHCVPTQDEAVYIYWREFEKAPPVRVHGPGMLDFIGYGISEQKLLLRTPTVGVQYVKLRQLPQMPVQIITTQGADGRCTTQARSTIGGKDRELLFAYVKLRSTFPTPSVEYVDVHGKDLETGQEVVERLRK
jgi:hypothetical protein